MFRPGLAICCLLMLCASGWRRQGPQERAENAEIVALRLSGNAHFQQGRYGQALDCYRRGYQTATRNGDSVSSARLLVNIAACRFATFSYRGAMEAYLEARRLSELTGDIDVQVISAIGLSGLYHQMDDLDSAESTARRAVSALAGCRKPSVRSQALIHVAQIEAARGDWPAAGRHFREAIESARAIGEVALEAQAWDQWGHASLLDARYEDAERGLLEAYRLRVLHHRDRLFLSYPKLGMLRQAQKALGAADVLFDRALEQATRAGSVRPVWFIRHRRGLLRLEQNRPKEALEDFREAAGMLRRWRVEVLPADAFRTSAAAGLHEVYSSYIETAARLGLAEESFLAFEENRAAALRQALASGLPDYPPEYGEALSRLLSLEARVLNGGETEVRRAAERAELEVAELEARSGRRQAAPPRGAGAVRARLGPSEALLAFHTGLSGSWRWLVDARGVELSPLPPRARLETLIRGFRDSLRSGRADAAELGARLGALLLAGTERYDRLRVVADIGLFDLPLGALVTRGGYLAERATVEIVPSASMAGLARTVGGGFLGVGDPVYNRADPRWKPLYRYRFRHVFGPFSPGPLPTGIEAARLPGSAREVEVCAARWDGGASSRVLTGAEANSRALRAAMPQDGILHLAAHVMRSSVGAAQANVALSLEPDSGGIEFLTPVSIPHLGLRPSLVVLSGCGSGRGDALPGEGLQGLARAWLLGGASSVVASLWSVPDDSGSLFLSFYEHLKRLRDTGPTPVADALRSAQTDMIRSKTWRAEPRYWAAYFVIGKE